MAELPEWVRKYKTKGVEIRVSGPNYYAYEMSSKWNPKKKRADKITGEYLGVVTREGIVKPRSIGMVRTDYEYGNIALLHRIAGIRIFVQQSSRTENIIIERVKVYKLTKIVLLWIKTLNY